MRTDFSELQNNENQTHRSWTWPVGYKSIRFTIKTKSGEISFSYHSVRGAKDLWLQIPGLENGGERIAAHRVSFLKKKINVLTFSYSAKEIPVDEIILATKQALVRIKSKKVDVLHSVSFGASCAVRLIGEVKVNRLILEAPAVTITALKKSSVAKFPFLLVAQKIGWMQKVMDLPQKMSWNFVWKALITVPANWWERGMPRTLIIIYPKDKVVDSNRIERYFRRIKGVEIVRIDGDPKRRNHLAKDYKEVARIESEFVVLG